MQNKVPFVKYEKIVSWLSAEEVSGLESEKAMVFEKIDGGNCQVRKINWQLMPGTRGNWLTGNRIERRPWFGKFLKWVYSNHSLYKLPENLIMFGEWTGHHTIHYDERSIDQFVLIDLFDLNTSACLDYENAKKTIKKLEIEDVNFLNILSRGKVTPNLLEKLLTEPSDYYSGRKEGLVIKDYFSRPQVFRKLYGEDFAEKRREGNGQIDYLQPQRFRKAVERLSDEGEISNLTIQDIVKEVIRDVREEEGVNYGETDVTRRALLHFGEGGKLEDVSCRVSRNQ